MDTILETSGQALLDIIKQLMAELRPANGSTAVTLDSFLDRELGFDSLGRVELLFRIERMFGMSLPEQVIATAETPRDLLNAVLKAGTASVPVPAKPIIVADHKVVRVTVDDAATLVEVLDRHVMANPDRTHILFAETEEQISYSGLRREAGSVAAGLQARGLRPGQTVAIMLPTGCHYFYSFYGILLAGGIPVPIYPPVRLAQVEDHIRRHAGILTNAQAALLITVPEAQAVAQLLKSVVRSLRAVVTVAELIESRAAFTPVAAQPDDIAFLQYTSGSTGAPKGVMLTHANLLANIRAMGQAARVDSDDVFVSWLPLYHDMGLIGAWLGSLYHAVTLVIMSPLTFLAHPERWLWAIHRYHGTLSAAPNFAYELCLRKVRDDALTGLDLSSWRLAFNGAESVNASTITSFQERFAAFGLRPEAMAPVYGLAECSVGLALPPPGRGPIIQRIRREPFLRTGQAVPADPGDEEALRIVACGQPLPGHKIRIVDAGGQELGERAEGRLEFQGPSATQGYFHNRAASQELFDGEWLKSGDLAYRADGDIFVTGRTKDIIVRAGHNLYPQEIETAVGAIPGVRKGCVVVFGSPDALSGTDRLVVLAETREAATEVREQLRRDINARVFDLLGEPPDDIVLAAPQTVLKTSSGKIRRAANRTLYEAGGADPYRQRGRWRLLARLAWASTVLRVHRAGRLAGTGLYALYAWTLFFVLAPVTWLMVALATRPAQGWRISHVMARWFVRLARVPFTIHGLENLPVDTPCVLVANHASYLDGILLMAAFSRPFGFIAKRELGDQWITDVYLRHIGTKFVERFRFEESVDGLKQLFRIMDGGGSLIFFPEGTFKSAPGLLPFHMGAFVIAAQTGVPLVAVTIRGSRSVLRDRAWLPHYGALSITISPAVLPTGTDWAAALRLRDAARAAILRDCGERDASSP
ncbi:MAG TPA: AMP-binding protein [Acidiferrobacter sp.]|nr:AMP-binding protein [Acidiferrobacter sp.]